MKCHSYGHFKVEAANGSRKLEVYLLKGTYFSTHILYRFLIALNCVNILSKFYLEN